MLLNQDQDLVADLSIAICSSCISTASTQYVVGQLKMKDEYEICVPQIQFGFCKEILVEKVHKFSSSGGELKEGHDALNLCQAEEEFREERAHL